MMLLRPPASSAAGEGAREMSNSEALQHGSVRDVMVKLFPANERNCRQPHLRSSHRISIARSVILSHSLMTPGNVIRETPYAAGF